ncbi:ATP-grasp domain-containing protein [Streptomyces sp. NPDC048191]|uniref:ATP-grasp domain-containing protein n=1 Tax=Streptomyces sp. NPDC048191 TaxID=3155484 RepID=UPI0033E65883
MTGNVRHVLIVGGSLTLPALVHAHDENVRLSAVCRRESLREYQDLKTFERLVSVSGHADGSEWVAAARFLNGVDPVDALLTTDDDVAHAADIGAALALPAPARRTVDAIDRKDLMREILAAAGVDPTPNRIVSAAPEIEAFAARVGYPLICKPVRGEGSQGISRIDGPDDVPRALERARAGTGGLASAEILVEPFHEGTEYSVECISEDGSHVVAGITAKYSETEGYVELGHVVPAPLADAEAERIGATVSAALSALGVTHGVTHTEVMVQPDAVRIIETHLRPGGDRIPYMLALARGIDLVGLLVRQCLGEKILDKARRAVASARDIPCYAAIWHAAPDRRGVLKAVEGVREAAAMEGVREVKLLLEVGQELGDLAESLSRPAHAWTLADTPEQALSQARAAVERLVFVTE